MSTAVNPKEPALHDLLLRPEDVVELIPGLKVKLLAEWRYRHQGPRFYKVGRVILYRFSDLEAWFESLEGGGEPGDD